MEQNAVQEEVLRLSQVTSELVDALRAQRQILRQRGMGLPPGTLNGLKTVQVDLERLANKLAGNVAELEQLRVMAQTTALINSTLDLNQVLNEVMDTVISLTGAERGYIVLRNTETGELEYRVARNIDRQTIDEGDFIVSRSIVGEVARTGKPEVTTNAQSDQRWGDKDSVVIHQLRSVLCVPLRVKDEVTGVVYADNRIKDAVFGDKELRLLVTFANQAATAIENARLFRSVQTALDEITEMKDLMDNVFASIASGVITTDVAQTVITYNTAAERILDVPASSALGTPLYITLPVLHNEIREYFDMIYQHGQQALLELEPALPSRGQVSLNLKLAPLKNQDTTEGVAIVVDDLTEIKRRDATLNVVRRYLSPAMVDNIQSLDELGLGGERRIITALFVEVRPFGAFPEDISPQELMERLNLYLTSGAEAIHNQNGVIDKFMGNEIMGLFNTQLNPSDEHAWQAVRAALKIADDFQALPLRFGEVPQPFHRIGIHYGVATLGNVGSADRKEFTAIGDTVNLAKRLQENAQPGQIIISDDIYRQCQAQFTNPANNLQVSELPSIQVKGRSQATKIYDVRREPC